MSHNKHNSESVRGFIQKLSRGLMVPIALLPIAGLFLGIGAGIENIMKDVANVPEDSTWLLLPSIIKNIGDVVFANLPLLFALGVAIAFSNDSGVAAFTAFVSWLVFNISQSLFIYEIPTGGGYSILWYNNVPNSIVTTTVGIKSTQSSVFGGIIVGYFAAFIYNKYKSVELPKILGFFNGTRLVPIMAFALAPILGFSFLVFWPIFGIILEKFGQVLLGLPFGLDSLIFGFTERSLIPFGLHHAFYSPLWYSTAGGQIVEVVYNATDGTWDLGASVAQGDQSMWFAIQNLGLDYNSLTETLWINVEGLSGYQVYLPEGLSSLPTSGTYSTYAITEGANPGQYQQGKYTFMIFGLPAAALAMIMTAEKDKRNFASSIVIASAITVFLTGITEPLEFTFLFLAPGLYVIHSILAAISFMSMDLVNANVGMTFSGGSIDLLIYGILPFATGYNVAFYWVFIFGIFYAIIYYFTFYYYITLKDVKTPGRGGENENTKLITKEEYKKLKGKKQKNNNKNLITEERKKELELLLYNLGGMENLKTIDSCISRLRLVVNDSNLLKDDEEFKKMGASGVMRLGKGAIQIIFGVSSDKYRLDLLELKNNNDHLSYEELVKKFEQDKNVVDDKNEDSINKENSEQEDVNDDNEIKNNKENISENEKEMDYSKMSITNLRKLLKEKEINYSSSDKKNDLIKLLKNSK